MEINKKGFTLIELLAVVSILSFIIILVYPSIGNVSSVTRNSLKTSKINSLVASAEKYGNANINNYQNCNYLTNSNDLFDKCQVYFNELESNNYIEYDNKTNNGILDPVTNQNLNGSVLLCYNSDTSTTYGIYIADVTKIGTTYTCNNTSFHSLTLASKSDYIPYQQSKTLTIDISTVGNFTGYSCSFPSGKGAFSSQLSCKVENKKLKVIYTGISGTYPYKEMQSINIQVEGKYKDSNNNVKKVTDSFTLYLSDYVSNDAKYLKVTIKDVNIPNAKTETRGCFQYNNKGCYITLPNINNIDCYQSYGYSKTQNSNQSEYTSGVNLLLTSDGTNNTLKDGMTIYRNYQKKNYIVTYNYNISGINNDTLTCSCSENVTPPSTKNTYTMTWSPTSAVCNKNLYFNGTPNIPSGNSSGGASRSSGGGNSKPEEMRFRDNGDGTATLQSRTKGSNGTWRDRSSNYTVEHQDDGSTVTKNQKGKVVSRTEPAGSIFVKAP